MVTYYSQTGQLKEILQNISHPFLQNKDEYEVIFYEIKLKKDFPFPWPEDVFYNTFPESYLQIPSEILPPPPEVLNQNFDLVIFGYQVWYLTPSIPIISFLKSEYAEQILKNKPIITVSATRNMWMLSQEKLKVHLKNLKTELVGNIALVDRHNNYTSVLTILNWMTSGKKEQKSPLPDAGVAQKEIDETGKYGEIIKKYFSQGNFAGMQQELVKNGAVEIRPFLLKVERVGNKIFTVFSKKIIGKQGDSRKKWIGIFKFYLMTAIWVISPIVLFFFTIFTPLFWWKRQKEIKIFQGL